jgi:excisionase family DNA binding protein
LQSSFTAASDGAVHPPQFAHSAETTHWLTASEAADYLRIKVRTLLFWARQGKVKAYALSGTKRHVWRFRAVDLDVMLFGPVVLSTNGRVQ